MNEVGKALNTCPLCDHEAEMPFVRERSKTYYKCPNPECGCEWEEDREKGDLARIADQKALAGWLDGVAGW